MKRILILLPLLLFHIWLNAQSSAPSKYRLAILGAPDISFFYGKTANDFGPQLPRLGYNLRAECEIRLKSKLWLLAGFGYDRNNYRTALNLTHLVTAQPNDPALKKYLDRTDRIFEFPVSIRYFATDRIYIQYHMSLNLIDDFSGIVGRLGLGCAFGYQVPLRSDLYLFMQPAFRFVVNNAFHGILSPYNVHPYSIGLETGLRGFLH